MANAVQLGAAIIDLLINEGLIDAQLLTAKTKAGAGGKAAGKAFGMGWTEAWSQLQILQSTVVPLMREALEQSREGTEIQTRLAAAFDGTTEAIDEYAKALLKTQGIDDERTKAAAAQSKVITKLSDEDIPALLQATLQVSAITKKSFEDSNEIVNRFVVNGMSRSFKMAGIQIEDTGSKIGNLEAVLKATSGGIALLDARAKDNTVAWEAMGQTYDNVLQSFGDGILKSESFGSAMRSLTDTMQRAIDSGQLEQFGNDIGKIAQALALFIEMGQRSEQTILSIVKASLTGGMSLVTDAMIAEAKWFGIGAEKAKEVAAEVAKLPPLLSDSADESEQLAGGLSSAATAADWLAGSVANANKNQEIMDAFHQREKKYWDDVYSKQDKFYAALADQRQNEEALYQRQIGAMQQIVNLAAAGNDKAKEWIADRPIALATLDQELAKKWALLTHEEKALKLLEMQQAKTEEIAESVSGVVAEWIEVDTVLGRALQSLQSMESYTSGVGDARVDALLQGLVDQLPGGSQMPGESRRSIDPDAYLNFLGSGIKGRTRDQLALLDELGRKTGVNTSQIELGSLGALTTAIRDLQQLLRQQQEANPLGRGYRYGNERTPTGAPGDPLHFVYDSQTSQAAQDASMGLR